MLYDVLEPFKEYLYANKEKNTAKTYYAAIVKLFKGININRIEDVSLEYLQREMVLRFKTRNEFSAAKNALKMMVEFYPQFHIPSEQFFKTQSMSKRNFSKKPRKVIYLQPTLRSINQISNEKLKYAYRLALVSGLRVSKLADLEPEDISFENGAIIVRVRHGKGGHGGVIRCREDAYLYEHLQKYVQEAVREPTQTGKLFYGEAKMRKEALRLGFECHDLRRIYAILTRRELGKQMPVKEADRIVQQNLRHVRFSTTKRYLYNRKLKMEDDINGWQRRK